MANKKIQITPEVDARQAVDGFAKVGKAADEMADKVKGAGKESQKGMEKLGDGGDEAARKVDRTTKSIISSIERTTAVMKAGGRGSAEYFEALAQQRGANVDALKPYLDGLRQAKAAQDAATVGLSNMGMTAKQTTAALRQVPAQFTDIAVSLAGGQNPMTVLLQQGGQLKDVFGSAGAAAQALGGYVLGLVNPLTLAAAAAAALAYGFFKGEEEAQAFNKALVLSGNAAGTTVGQLTAMAERMDALGTTQSKASESLVEFINAGVKGADGLERYTLAAINLEKVGGPAIKETAKAFADLGKDPLKAAVKLNEAANFLTRSLYEQIKSLTEQGRATDAARVAQDAYADAINNRTPQILEQLGFIERKWMSIKGGAKEAGDALLSIGRTESLSSRRDTAQSAVNAASSKIYDAKNGSGLPPGSFGELARQRELAVQEEIIAKNKVLIQDINERLRREQQLAAVGATNAQFLKDSISAEEELKRLGVRRLSDKQEEENLSARLRAGGVEELDIQKAIAAQREKRRDKSADTAATRELEAQRKLLAEMNGLSGDFYEDWNRLSILFKSGAFKTIEDFEGAQRKLLESQPISKERERALKEEADLAKKAAAERLKSADAYAKWLEELNKSGAAVADQVIALQDEAVAAGIAAAKNISLAQAIEEVAIARLNAKREDAGNQLEIDAIDREIAKRRELITAIAVKEDRTKTEAALKDLDKFLDPAKADDFGAALTKAFDGAGDSLAKMVTLLGRASQQQAVFAKQRENLAKETDPQERLRKQLALNRVAERESLELYAGLTSAAKGFFDEGTKGYKALEAAETAFRVYQLASDLQKGLSAAAVGVANQAQGDPYTAIPRMAAMAAIMAGLGYAIGGFGGGGSSGGDGAKQATGTGTVLGNAESQSESITRSIDLLGDTAQLQLRTQSGMLDALRSIEARIGGITNQVLRSGTATGDVASAFGITTGKTSPKIVDNFFTGGGNGPSLLMGNLIRSLFNTKTNITGSGLSAGPQSVESILGSGFNLQNFADVNSKSKFFGITVSNKNSTEYQAADPALSRQFGLVFQDFANALSLAADPLGLALNDVKERINAFTIDIGKIDLKDLTGEEIAEKLGAILGAAADNLATAAIPGLLEFQRVGEGYFETTIRVAAGVETAGAALDLLGITAVSFGDVARKQGDVAAEIVRQSIAGFESLDGSISSIGEIIKTLDGSADDLAQTYSALLDVRDVLLSVGESGDSLTAALIRGAGGLDALQGSLDSYFESFFSDQEKTAARIARLSEQFARLGLALPEDRAGFRALVEGIDDSTAAGQILKGQVLGLAEAFDQAAQSSDNLKSQLGSAIDAALPKFLSASQQSALQYQRIAANLAEAGVGIAVESLLSATKAEIFDFAQSFVSLGSNSTEAKLAVVNAASALADLKKSAEGVIQVGPYKNIDAKKFGAEVSSITAADIRAAVGGPDWLRQGGIGDLSQAQMGSLTTPQLNFAVGTSTWLSGFTNSLAAARLAAGPVAEPWNKEKGGDGGRMADEMARQAEEEARIQRDLIDSLDRLSKSLDEELQNLLVGELSPLSKQEQLAQADKQLDQLFERARSGDTEAGEQFAGQAREFLQIAQAFSPAQYASVFKELVARMQELRDQVNNLNETAKAGNSISLTGLSAVERAANAGAEATASVVESATLARQRTVGLEL